MIPTNKMTAATGGLLAARSRRTKVMTAGSSVRITGAAIAPIFIFLPRARSLGVISYIATDGFKSSANTHVRAATHSDTFGILILGFPVK